MTFHAALGHACGIGFKASEPAKYPEFEVDARDPARHAGKEAGRNFQ
jgi:hypothetical protein